MPPPFRPRGEMQERALFCIRLGPEKKMERETGLEPAT